MFEAGTVWTYHTHVSAPQSHVHISHRFRMKGHGTLYYVFIEHDNVHLSYPGGIDAVVTKKVLEESCIAIVPGKDAIDMDDGLMQWKEDARNKLLQPNDDTLSDIVGFYLEYITRR